MLLSTLNPHERDNRLTYDDANHKYTVDGDISHISCTTFTNSFFGPFNRDEAIQNIVNSDRYISDPTYKYYLKSSDEIKKMWKATTTDGTDLHADIEHFLNGGKVVNTSKEYAFFQLFHKNHTKTKAYRTEWKIFSETVKISGAVDAVYVNDDGTFTLYDWKRSPVDYGKWKYALEPLQHLHDNKFNKYGLQLNLYRHILECHYGIKIRDMFIIELHPDNDSFKEIEIPRMEKEMEDILATRSRDIQQPLMRPRRGVSSKSPPAVVEKSNRGTKWSVDEDAQLLTALKNKKSFLEIAMTHSRSENGIRLRVLRNAAIEITEKKKSIDVVCDLYNISDDQLQKYIDSNVVEVKKKDSKAKISDVIEKLKYTPSSPSSTSSGEILEEMRPTKKKKTIVLSKKQELAVEMMCKRKSIFLTGPGGTGKSLVLSIYEKREYNRVIAKTATTGTAAILLNGTTLYSYLGIGTGELSVDMLIREIKKKKHILKRWTDLDVLIIDEISMLSPELFDKLELTARSVRQDTRPFGGIQLILTGDFLQLPNISQKDMFCFDAESWEKCIGNNVVYLDVNFRQEGDDEYQRCLGEVRNGVLSDKTISILKGRENAVLVNDHGILPTKIYSLNRDVDEENQMQNDLLFEKNPELQFFGFELNKTIHKKVYSPDEKIKKSCNAPLTLELCVGSQVMLLYNMDLESKLVNGSRGVVVDFQDDDPIVRFLTGERRVIGRKTWEIEENNDLVITVTQIPLKLAYATTVHKSQGATIDYAEINMNGIFEYGQAYVALSRVKSLLGLSIKNFNSDVIKSHPKVIEFYSKYV